MVVISTKISSPGTACKLGKDGTVFCLEAAQGLFTISENHVTSATLPATLCLQPPSRVTMHTGVTADNFTGPVVSEHAHKERQDLKAYLPFILSLGRNDSILWSLSNQQCRQGTL